MVKEYNPDELSQMFGAPSGWWTQRRPSIIRLGLARKLGGRVFIDPRRLGRYLAGGMTDEERTPVLYRMSMQIETITELIADLHGVDDLTRSEIVDEATKTLSELRSAVRAMYRVSHEQALDAD